MEGRRTRGRFKRVEEVTAPAAVSSDKYQVAAGATKRSSAAPAARRTTPTRTRSSPARRVSPGRTRVSPVRRSSRPRSVLGAAASTAAVLTNVTPPSPIAEAKESKSKGSSNLPTTLTTNTSTRAPHKSQTTSSVHSSYSSSTQKTIEIRSSSSAAAGIDSELSKLSDYIRRSVSKGIVSAANLARGGEERATTHTPTTNTDAPDSQRDSHSVSRSVYDEDNYSKAEFSGNENDVDDEENEHYKSFSSTQPPPLVAGLSSSASQLCRQIEVPREFGGCWGAAALMLLGPGLVYYLQWCCANGASACTFRPPIWNAQNLMRTLFQGPAVGAYLAFNCGVFVLSAILFGRHVRLASERSSVEYKFNALPMAALMTIAVGVAEYATKYAVVDFVLAHQLRFCLYGILNAFIVALWCYIRADLLRQQRDVSQQLNAYGKSGNVLVDFALGRQLNPKWLDLVDFKQVFYRVSLMTTLLLAQCFIFKSLHWPKAAAPADATALSWLQFYATNVKFDTVPLLAAALLWLYIWDAIIFEHHLASSFELQGEGFGCLLLLRYAATPFLLSAVARYFRDRNDTPLACKYAVYVSVILLLAGLVLKRLSSAVKYKYRINPTNVMFYGTESIHTYQGRRLLLGALWGRLRQPNYAGDMLALLALSVPLFLRFAWPPLVALLLLIVLLLHRSLRVNARNLSRYHSSWVRYCSTVRYYVLPKVF